MRNCYHGAVFETLVHGLINDGLRFDVNVGCCLIYKHYSRWLEDGSADTYELTLSCAQIFSVLGDGGLEALPGVNHFFECAQFE